MPHLTPRWTPAAEPHRVRILRRRHGLDGALARLVAGLAFGEGRA